MKIKSVEQVSSNEEILKIAITKTVITVGKLLLDKQAILLASVHTVFKKYVRERVVAKGI